MDEGRLIDFDFTVVATISSSHLSNMRKPLTMLNLRLKYADGTEQNKLIELSESDLDEMLLKLSSANSTLEKWHA